MVSRIRTKKSYNLKENVITDLRQTLSYLNRWDRSQAEKWFRESDINIEDCKLVSIPKPKGPTIAKKSEWPIIAVDNNGNVSWFGNSAYKHTGNYKFNGMKQSDAFNRATEFYQVVPKDVATYQSRSAVADTKTPGKFVNIDTYSRDGYRRRYNTSLTPRKGTRFLTDTELALYNPETNRNRYEQALAELGADRYIEMYDNLCDEVIVLNQRINSIDLGNLIKYNSYSAKQRDYRTKIGYYTTAVNIYQQTVYAFEHFHDDIKNMADDRWGKPTKWEYQSIKNDIDVIKDRIKQVNKYLDLIDM